MNKIEVTNEEVEALFKRLDQDAEDGGYHLNPDMSFTKSLVKGLLINEKRYGYPACPCRLASGVKADDLDIICPCDYRDPDLSKFGSCYCALYVSSDVVEGKKKVRPIPERRPSEEVRKKMKEKLKSGEMKSNLKLPVWRCRVCGYLCAREEPPDVCPICKASKDRFEIFLQ
jgi:ferredoxin-thioredoxin reductase catalytic subunit